MVTDVMVRVTQRGRDGHVGPVVTTQTVVTSLTLTLSDDRFTLDGRVRWTAWSAG